ncbi:hypothetical protein AB6A40_008210 [Gnathostoma spinigerum]|uniref:Transmembrane protein n=1 Tax=Gnathostoma spinigerum TaxID=75299 RepID=A0ABD6ENW2_9BILA
MRYAVNCSPRQHFNTFHTRIFCRSGHSSSCSSKKYECNLAISLVFVGVVFVVLAGIIGRDCGPPVVCKSRRMTHPSQLLPLDLDDNILHIATFSNLPIQSAIPE